MSVETQSPVAVGANNTVARPSAIVHFDFPDFKPHPLFRGGHAQTVAGTYLPFTAAPYRAARHNVQLDDGDVIVLHDDIPPGWCAGDKVAMLIHGLAGCHQSGYMIRIAAKLNDVGIRAFRLDLRNCGAGQGLAKNPYNAGRSEDALAAIRIIEQLCPGSPIGLAGFSLGGNIVLKLLGETPERVPAAVTQAVVGSPSLDLAACVEGLKRPGFGVYDRFFVQLLCRQIDETRLKRPDVPEHGFKRMPRRIVEFDDAYTAPVCGYGTAENYYATCSASQFVPNIQTPTLIIAAADDPLVPVRVFECLSLSPATQLRITKSGGHLGFVGRGGIDSDRRWLDWRVVDWLRHTPSRPL